jgi:hypothetical protein
MAFAATTLYAMSAPIQERQTTPSGDEISAMALSFFGKNLIDNPFTRN